MATNLEWLMEHDRKAVVDFLDCAVNMCNNCAYDKYRIDGKCPNGSEWLMAEHEPTNEIGSETNGISDDSPLVDVLRNMHGELYETTRKRWASEVTIGEYNAEVNDITSKYADMVERDYVKREELPSYTADAVYVEQLEAERDELKSRHCPHYHADKHYCDIHETRINALIAERDEWKAKAEQAEHAMNKAAGKWARADIRSAKRAAAVERVRKAKDAGTSIGYAIVGREYYPWEAYETLIDLLTDEPMDIQRDSNGTCPDAMGQSPNHSKSEPKLTEQSESLSDAISENHGKSQNSEIDSHEKLEADANRLADVFTDSYSDYSELCGEIIELLYRQAAITERECKERVDFSLITQTANALFPDYQERIAELERKLEAATNANDDYRNEWHRVCAERMDLRRELTASKNEGVRLAEELGKTMAERDQWRDKCGAMLDVAQEIRRLADIE